MSERYRIAIVEDTDSQRMMLVHLLSKKYDVEEFPSGEAFIASSSDFDAILLDIEMPGIDGYETCRCMRVDARRADTPVIFVSSHNTPEDRVLAYEAGGDHFVSKPINIGELSHKIESVIAHGNALRELKSRSEWAQQVAFSAMAGMGGLGVIVEFFRKSARINDYQSLADLIVESLKAWELRAGVQLRGLSGEVETSTDAVISPLQASVMANMRNMGRIFELKSRAVINFEHISILVYNMPSDDPEKVGRMRDNLAWIGEGADTCIANMDALNERAQRIGYLGDKIDEITNLMQKAAVSDLTNRNLAQRLAIGALEGLAVSVNGFCLTNIQNEYVISAVQEGVDELNACFEEAATIQRDFSEILFLLQSLARYEKSHLTGPTFSSVPAASGPSSAKDDSVVLF